MTSSVIASIYKKQPTQWVGSYSQGILKIDGKYRYCLLFTSSCEQQNSLWKRSFSSYIWKAIISIVLHHYKKIREREEWMREEREERDWGFSGIWVDSAVVMPNGKQ